MQCNYVRKLRVSGPDTIKENITYENLLQDANYDYQQLIYSKTWVPFTTDNNSNELTLSKVYYAETKTTVADALRKSVFFNRR